jgi:hypothetical protein
MDYKEYEKQRKRIAEYERLNAQIKNLSSIETGVGLVTIQGHFIDEKVVLSGREVVEVNLKFIKEKLAEYRKALEAL